MFYLSDLRTGFESIYNANVYRRQNENSFNQVEHRRYYRFIKSSKFGSRPKNDNCYINNVSRLISSAQKNVVRVGVGYDLQRGGQALLYVHHLLHKNVYINEGYMHIKSLRFAPPPKKKQKKEWFTYHTAHFPYTLLYPPVGWCVINQRYVVIQDLVQILIIFNSRHSMKDVQDEECQ